MYKLFMRIETNVELDVKEEGDGLGAVKKMTATDTKMYLSTDCINWTLVDGLELAEHLTSEVMGRIKGLQEGIGS